MHKILQNHLLCAFVANLKIGALYALYPESFCGKNLAIRKVFAFCDSGRGQARQPSRPLAADLSPSAQEKTSHRAESKDQSTHVCFALRQLTINKKRPNSVNCYLFTWINCGAMRAALRRSTPGHAVRAAVDEPEFVFAFIFVLCLFWPFFFLGFVFVSIFVQLLWLSLFPCFHYWKRAGPGKIPQYDIMIVSWHNFYG